MAYAIMGVDVTNTGTTSEYLLGTRYLDDSANEWLYVQAGVGGSTLNYAAFVDEAYSSVMITTTNGTYGGLVGVPAVTIAASSYGWVQVFGNTTVQAAATVSADVQLSTTATDGVLDDATTGGVKAVGGIKLNTANTGVAGAASCFLNHPYVGATLA